MKFRVNWTIVIILILMWLGFMVFFYLKADEITKDPCSICAKSLNERVICSMSGTGAIIQRTYYPNMSIDYYTNIQKPNKTYELNFTPFQDVRT